MECTRDFCTRCGLCNRENKVNNLAGWFEADPSFAKKIVRDGLALGLGFEGALLGAKMVLSVATLKNYPLFPEDIALLVGCTAEDAGGVLAESEKRGKIDFLPEYDQLLKIHLAPFLRQVCGRLEGRCG